MFAETKLSALALACSVLHLGLDMDEARVLTIPLRRCHGQLNDRKRGWTEPIAIQTGKRQSVLKNNDPKTNCAASQPKLKAAQPVLSQ